jgi:hypothetical protein
VHPTQFQRMKTLNTVLGISKKRIYSSPLEIVGCTDFGRINFIS